MKKNLVTMFLLALGFVTVLHPVFAHHSVAPFDMEHAITIKGTVTNFEWSNPHTWIYLAVKDNDGTVEQWRIEGNSPNMLTRVGWKREMIKPGDQETVIGFPAKNGKKVMRMDSILLTNGQKFDGQGLKY